MDEIELLDIADDLLVINKTTIERLFQEENTDVLVLYLFYYKTAKWQKHNPIKANDEYSRRCLHWGLDKLKKVKKRLKEIELISIEKRTNEKSQIVGWYVRVNYIVDKVDISSGVISTSRLSPLVAKPDHKILLNNNINTINNKDTRRFTPPTLEDIKDYCLNVRHNSVDYQKFYDYYTAGNWKDSKGNKIKNWKQKVITWEKKDRKEFDYEYL